MLFVRNIFMKNLFITKSKELSSDLTRGHASRPYNKLTYQLRYGQHSAMPLKENIFN